MGWPYLPLNPDCPVPELTSSSLIEYVGVDLTCTTILNGDTLTEALVKINTEICTLQQGVVITPSALTKINDTNITLTLGGTPATSLLQDVELTVGWTGTLADNRITSSNNWNTAYTNRITSLTTTGNSGVSTLIANILNIPNYSLSGLGGQPALDGIGFVKANGTVISYDNSTYLTSLSGAVLLDQTIPQTFTAGTVTGSGLLKVTSGTLGLDTNTYLTSADISGKEDKSNKVIAISVLSTDIEYPSAKLLYDQLAGKIDVYTSQTAKYVLAAPNAIDGVPSFRALVASDIPTLSYGDMYLGTVQSVTALKTFDKDKLATKGTSTGVTIISTANTSATDYTAILPAKDGTIAMTSDIPDITGKLNLDQTVPQTIINGAPIFSVGLKAGSANQYNIDSLGNVITSGYSTNNNFSVSNHYTGFPDRVNTSLSFDDGTYTLTLTATADPIWIDGVSYLINTLTKQLTISQEAISGLYWYWITAPLGVPQLNVDLAHPGWDKCLVASVYWNTTINNGIISDERHWMGRDKWWHEYTHQTIGARYAGGMAGVFTDATIEIGVGEFYDEDIEHSWSSPITTVEVMYHNGDTDWQWDILTTPYKVVNPGINNTLYYNNGNALVTVDNNKYVNYWVYATGGVDYPIQVFLGTAQYTTLALARAALPPSLGAVTTAENKLIYKIIYQNNGGTPDYNETIDYRTASSLPGTYVATDHGTLTGLTDLDHPASAIINTPSGNIIATTVQAAIDELDNEKVDKSLFDPHTIIYAITDNIPVALTVGEQTLVGRLTGGNISAVVIGIADNNILQIDASDVADNDYAKFTANGLEGRNYAEVLNDIGAEPHDDDLTAIAALGFTSTSFLKKTALNTWALDTSVYVIKSGDTGLGNMTFNNNAVIDVISSAGTDVLNIGTGNADIINIGYSGSTININGVLSYQAVDNLTVKDKLITLNKGGGIDSGVSSGFEVEENSLIKGWFTTSAARTGFELRAPATSNSAIFLLSSLGAERTYTYPDASGTIALTSNLHNAVTLATNSGLELSTQVLNMGTPSSITTSSTNSVTTSTHTHAITAALGLIGNGSAANQMLITGTTPFAPTWTAADNLVSLNALSFASTSFVKMTAAGTFALDTTVYTTNTGTVTSVSMSVPTGLSVSGIPITTAGTLALSLTTGYSIPTTSKQSEWDSAYSDRMKWDGGSTGLTASTGRTSLGGTTIGQAIFISTNPSAITFGRANADNSFSWLSAADFRTAIGAGTSSTVGTVTSVAALTLGTTGTDLSSTVANGSTTPVITLNVPTASATNRGALSSTDWSTFNSKQAALIFGIANTNAVKIDAADVADNDYAKFTATGLEGRSYSEVLSDIGAAASSHVHGNITNAGYLGSTATIPLITGTAGIIQAGSFGTGAGTFCQGNDARLSDARTAVAHNLLSTIHGDTLADSVVRGDIIIGNSTPKWARLAFPASPTGKFIIASATDVGWSSSAIGTMAYETAANYVPYTGATTNVTLGNYNLTASNLILGTNNTSWLKGIDYAGNSANILKLSSDNLIEFGQTVAISSLYHVANQELTDIVNIPVNGDSVSGTIHGVSISIGGVRIFEVSGVSDGTGGLSSSGVTTVVEHETTDVDKFVVSNTGKLKYRTGAEVLDDIIVSVAERASVSNVVTIGFTNSDPITVYTLLDENVTTLTLTTTGAIVGKKVVWYVKGNYTIAFGSYIKAESSYTYGGVHARIDLECGVNPTDGTVQFWYNIINVAV